MLVKQVSSGKGLVVFLAYYYPPQNTSGAARPFRFVRYLPKSGFDTQVISAGDLGIRDGQANVRRVPDQASPLSAVIASRAGAAVQRLFLPYQEHLPWVPHAVAAVRRVHAARPISAIISTSPPIATHLAALTVKRRLGVRWIADFRDPMAGNPFRLDWRSRIYDPLLERKIFRHADAVIANTEPLAEWWRERYPSWRHKIHVIWNGFDPQEALPTRKAPQRAHRVLAHIGTLYGERHPGALLASLERLIEAGSIAPESIRVRLVGPIEADTTFLDAVPIGRLRERGCLELVGAVSRQESIQEMADADALLLLDLNASQMGVQVPAKLFDYIRAGSPILTFTARGSGTDSILARCGVPSVRIYTDEGPPAIDEKVAAFFRMPFCPSVPSTWFRDQFDANPQAMHLASLIQEGTAPEEAHDGEFVQQPPALHQ